VRCIILISWSLTRILRRLVSTASADWQLEQFLEHQVVERVGVWTSILINCRRD
jgi:hypothetical protein